MLKIIRNVYQFDFDISYLINPIWELYNAVKQNSAENNVQIFKMKIFVWEIQFCLVSFSTFSWAIDDLFKGFCYFMKYSHNQNKTN